MMCDCDLLERNSVGESHGEVNERFEKLLSVRRTYWGIAILSYAFAFMDLLPLVMAGVPQKISGTPFQLPLSACRHSDK